jgi:predicted nuclease of predicted toxin-antitoxin system
MDASLPRSASSLLRTLGHDVVDVRDTGLRGASDEAIAAHVRNTRQILVTRDFDFSDIRNYPPSDYSGIVVLKLPDDATTQRLIEVLEFFVRQEDWLAHLPGRLAIVEGWRVRFRPA